MSKLGKTPLTRGLQRKTGEIQTGKTHLQQHDSLFQTSNYNTESEGNSLCEITSIHMRNPRTSQVKYK